MPQRGRDKRQIFLSAKEVGTARCAVRGPAARRLLLVTKSSLPLLFVFGLSSARLCASHRTTTDAFTDTRTQSYRDGAAFLSCASLWWGEISPPSGAMD